jgi:hypothetical protein
VAIGVAGVLAAAAAPRTTGAALGTSTTLTSGSQAGGTLSASFEVGPTSPVCYANATESPAPAPYGTVVAVVTPASGGNLTIPLDWTSNGCGVHASLTVSLPPGSYSLDLSPCKFLGCPRALPLSFAISADAATTVDVAIDTGIR